MADDILEGNEEPLVQAEKLTPEEEDEQSWARLSEWDGEHPEFRWAFEELEAIFGKGRVALGAVDFGHRIGAGVKMRFANGVVVRNAIYLRFPPHVEAEEGFDLNSLDRDNALVWLRVEAKLVRARGSHAARREWLARHPEAED